ncbi:unnamed protein product [Angiostrongylus costaricensis]|uniref:Secreted protein n=1 Tax=Angiostrongylus costaricensis TaxID=334426 RepID=A0A0R3PT25_ANGCS|nr:unnamed protein product [Angiostrongylus costaricensis]
MRCSIWVATALVAVAYCQYDIEEGHSDGNIYHQSGVKTNDSVSDLAKRLVLGGFDYVYGPFYGGMVPFYGGGLAGFGYQEPTPSGYQQPPPPLPYSYPPMLPAVDYHQLIPPICCDYLRPTIVCQPFDGAFVVAPPPISNPSKHQVFADVKSMQKMASRKKLFNKS